MKKSETKSSKVKRRGWRKYLPYLILVVAVMIAYSNTLNTGFHFDDETSILKNSQIRSFADFDDLNDWTNIHNRPLAYFTFAINYSLHGLKPTGYHLFNLILHLLSCMLVYSLANKLLKLKSNTLADKNRTYIALGIALLFALHPLQTMAATYVSQRITILVALFYIMSIWFYLQARLDHMKNGIHNRNLLFYGAAVISAFLALLSKQNAATLPLMWWFIDFFFIRRENGKKDVKFLSILGGLILLALISVLLFGLLPKETESISRLQYLITQFRVYLLYLGLVIFPFNLNIDHGINISQNLLGLQETSGLILILLLIAVAIWLYKKQPLISFGIAWFFITISIESSIIPISDPMMEHRMYLPMFGISLVLINLIYLLFRKHLTRFAMVLGLVLVLLGIRTYNRNADWENNTTIWLSSLEENPNNKRALVYIGRTYVTTDLDRAMKYFERAIAVDSSYYHGWLNRGMVFYNKRQFGKAAENFTRAVDIPGREHDYIFYLRGVSYLQLEKYHRALNDLNIYILKVSNDVEAFIYRGQVNYALKKYRQSGEDFLRAVQLDPSRKQIYLNLVEIYYRLKDVQKMKQYIQIAQQNKLKVPKPYLNFVKDK
ncbi:MAG: tetratricopeptide repeat protein [Bacteroidales bacterium]|nr:tetratricopeptide repeat protein [Bacteroidales bacterium]